MVCPADLRPSDLDGGYADRLATPPRLWRRAITAEQRQSLARRGESADHLDDIDQAWNYVLLYRERTTIETLRRGGRGFVVERVLSNRQLAHVWLKRPGR